MEICPECNDYVEDADFNGSGMCFDCFDCCCPVCLSFVSDKDYQDSGMCTACF